MLVPKESPRNARGALEALALVAFLAIFGSWLLGCGAPPIDTKTTVSVQIASTDNKTRHSRPGPGLPADVVLERAPARVGVLLEETSTAVLPADGLELRVWSRHGGLETPWSELRSIVLELGGAAELGAVAGDELWFEVVRIDREGSLELTLDVGP